MVTFFLFVNPLASSSPKIYPNPAMDKLYVNFVVSRQVNIIVYDLKGRVIKTLLNQYGKNIQIDLTDVIPGIYMLSIQSENSVKNTKFVKL